MPALLEMFGVSKAFPGVQALDNVSLSVRAGEVHALLGENGAGKSTLIKILAGIHRADAGEIHLEGRRLDVANVETALQAGISVIHQELALAPDLTVAENMYMGNEPVRRIPRGLDRRAMRQQAAQVIEHYRLPIDADSRVGDLTIAQQQMVEIARGLTAAVRVIVMDEPTASLGSDESQLLFAAIRELQSRGVAVIYISHRFDELRQIAERVTVLRDGRNIDTFDLDAVEDGELVRAMVGTDLAEFFTRPETKIGDVILEVANLGDGRKVRDCSFELRHGEILGFFGLVGSGRTELMRLVFGVDAPTTGTMRLDGNRYDPAGPAAAIASGLALVPEDRKGEGVVLDQSVRFNLTLPSLDRFWRGGRLARHAERAMTDRFVRSLRIRTPSQDQKVRLLSGGNQQKVVIAKWLATQPRILILDEPTRGIDIGAKREIYDLMSDLVVGGISIVLVSSDLVEIVNMSSRVVTMSEGRVSAVLQGDEIDRENILRHATIGAAA
jgi:ABC-type sugar transport system ATPase subunit